MTPIEECPEIYQSLKQSVDKLVMLLAAPEPGLWSWCNCVAMQAAVISKLYGDDGVFPLPESRVGNRQRKRTGR